MSDDVTMDRWSGRDARALREANRMTVREWGAHLGVSERTVSKWESAGELLIPRPEMQAALDTALAKAAAAVKARFVQLLNGVGGSGAAQDGTWTWLHRFFCTHVGMDAVEALKRQRRLTPAHALPTWLAAKAERLRDKPHAVTGRPQGHKADLYLFGCGVAIVHLCDRVDTPRLAQIATSHYGQVGADYDWACEQLASRLEAVGHKLDDGPSVGAPLYWVSELGRPDNDRANALRLLCMPGLLVDRDHPGGPRAVSETAERFLLTVGVEHLDVYGFGLRGVSVGFASWAGHAYMPTARDKALSLDDVVSIELTVRTLWCYQRWLMADPQTGRGQPAAGCGPDWLRAAHRSLSHPSRPIQQLLLAEALVKATELDEYHDGALALLDRPHK